MLVPSRLGCRKVELFSSTPVFMKACSYLAAMALFDEQWFENATAEYFGGGALALTVFLFAIIQKWTLRTWAIVLGHLFPVTLMALAIPYAIHSSCGVRVWPWWVWLAALITTALMIYWMWYGIAAILVRAKKTTLDPEVPADTYEEQREQAEARHAFQQQARTERLSPTQRPTLNTARVTRGKVMPNTTTQKLAPIKNQQRVLHNARWVPNFDQSDFDVREFPEMTKPFCHFEADLVTPSTHYNFTFKLMTEHGQPTPDGKLISVFDEVALDFRCRDRSLQLYIHEHEYHYHPSWSVPNPTKLNIKIDLVKNSMAQIFIRVNANGEVVWGVPFPPDRRAKVALIVWTEFVPPKMLFEHIGLTQQTDK